MTQNESRYRRRAGNQVARAVFDEARRAGLVRRHLLKLRYLADHPQQHGESPPAPFPLGGTPRKRRRKPAVQLAFDFEQPTEAEADRTTTGQSTSDAA
ncbi:hypothetical protein VSH64_23840 [Amycolatopsis rhabdoformis]|uniref:Uncharacterized protein n=1 Tax=Amycolatopsis rhabdoformis TaxID=1448059 RepID=A0ABZ1HU04_9PSEU|nr:hypothetical protein [Amycolatopsis rhabdoformis]WSE25921.1 hypothetical protein VSH64_23840 [Amycolatopsis rhabdoformis]